LKKTARLGQSEFGRYSLFSNRDPDLYPFGVFSPSGSWNPHPIAEFNNPNSPVRANVDTGCMLAVLAKASDRVVGSGFNG
jgi:hypothetical protein